MLSHLFVVASVVLSLLSAWAARRVASEAEKARRALDAAIDQATLPEKELDSDEEQFSAVGGPLVPVSPLWSNLLFSPEDDRDLRETVRRVFLSQQEQEAVAWLLELQSGSKSLRVRLAGMSRGLVRVPFLAAVGASIALVALERLDVSALTRAGICIGLGLVVSVANQVAVGSARKSLRRYEASVDTLATQYRRVKTVP